MKNSYLKLIFIILFIIFLGFFSNLIIDSYGILGRNLQYQTLEPNQNYIKTKYILRNPQKFNAFIFGSSRVGNIPTEDIKNYKFYNMGYSEGLPKEWEETLNIFIRNKVVPQIIILGIDDLSFKIDPNLHEKELLRKSFNKVNIIKDYILTNPLTKYNFIKLKTLIFSKKNDDFKIDFEDSGRLFRKERLLKEKEIQNNPNDHLHKRVFKEKNGYALLNNVQKENSISMLDSIVDLCEKNKIKLILLFNPVHPNSYRDELAKIEYRKIRIEIKNRYKNIKVYDFAEHDVTKNNLYWFETSHFNLEVGKMMLKSFEELN